MIEVRITDKQEELVPFLWLLQLNMFYTDSDGLVDYWISDLYVRGSWNCPCYQMGRLWPWLVKLSYQYSSVSQGSALMRHLKKWNDIYLFCQKSDSVKQFNKRYSNTQTVYVQTAEMKTLLLSGTLSRRYAARDKNVQSFWQKMANEASAKSGCVVAAQFYWGIWSNYFL